MSARVFNNSVLVSELKHIRSSLLDNSMTNFTPNKFVALSPVRRDLFGPINHEECQRFVDRELDRQQSLNTDHWEFDFQNEVPRPGKGRYIWEITTEKPNLRPQKREFVDTNNDITSLYHIPLDDTTPEKEVKSTFVKINKKQAKITDFLKVNKNGQNHRKMDQMKLSQIKKSIATPSPRIGKIPRTRRLKI